MLSMSRNTYSAALLVVLLAVVLVSLAFHSAGVLRSDSVDYVNISSGLLAVPPTAPFPASPPRHSPPLVLSRRTPPPSPPPPHLPPAIPDVDLDPDPTSPPSSLPSPLSSSPSISSVQRSVSCWQKGEWVYDSGAEPLFDHYNVCPHRVCPLLADNWKWRWRPWGAHHLRPDESLELQYGPLDGDEECAASYVDFDGGDFCRVLDGRNVLVVGDSLSSQFHDTLLLMSQLRSEELQQQRRPFCHESLCSGHTICDDDSESYKPAMVRFFRSYDLGTRSSWLPANHSHRDSYEPWFPSVGDSQVVVLNRECTTRTIRCSALRCRPVSND